MKCERDLLRVNEIRVPEGRRNTDPGTVKNLAESMARIGLQCPITVRLTEDDAGAYVDLVVGAHRLAAAKLLGWTDIEGMVMPASATAVDAEMWEISENLHRAELSEGQRSKQVARWIVLAQARMIEISAQLAPKSPQVGVGKGVGAGRPEGGIRAAARELGIGRDEAARRMKIASIPDEVLDAAESSGLGDNQRALLKIAAAPEPAAKLAEIVKQKAAPKPRPAPQQSKASNPEESPLDDATRDHRAQLRAHRAKLTDEEWVFFRSAEIEYMEAMQ